MTDSDDRAASADGAARDSGNGPDQGAGPPAPGERDPRVVVRAQSRAGHRRKPRKRHTLAQLLIGVGLAFALVLSMSGAFFYRHLGANINVVDIDDDVLGARPIAPVPTGPNGPINILVMGIDSRDCEGCDIDGIPGGEGSDTTILLHLSADRKSAYGVSIPRDSLVDRPECRDANDREIIRPAASDVMWNAAYGVGGEACVRAQFEANTDIRIDNYVSVNFGNFGSMVDAIGGVEVCVPHDIHSEDYGIFIPEGTRKIDGKEALAYVRVRHGIGDGSDIGRVKRQQAFIGSMAGQTLSAGTLTNPLKVTRLLDSATKSLTTDMDLTSLAGLALQFKDVGAGGIQFVTVPFEYPAWDPNRVVWTDEANLVWDALREDKPLPEELSGQAIIKVDHLPGTDVDETAKPSPSPSSSPSPSDSPSPLEPSASPSASISKGPVLEANGRTKAENQALEDAGLCV